MAMPPSSTWTEPAGDAKGPAPALVDPVGRRPRWGLVWFGIALAVMAVGMAFLPSGPESGDGTGCGSIVRPNFGSWSSLGDGYDSLTSTASASGGCAVVYGSAAFTVGLLVRAAVALVGLGALAGPRARPFVMAAVVLAIAAAILALWAVVGIAAVFGGGTAYAESARWLAGGAALACAAVAWAAHAFE